MQNIFVNVLQMSFQGSIVILAVMLLRLMLKKAPRRAVCLLWLLAGLRLLVPFQMESPLSLQPDYEPVPWEQTGDELSVPEYAQGRGEILDAQGNVLVTKPLGSPSGSEDTQGWGEILDAQGNVLVSKPLKSGAPVEAAPDWVFWIPYIWLAGVAAMVLYTTASYWNLKGKVADAVILDEGVWMTNRVDSPFLLGFVHPKIYLPVGLAAEVRPFVLAHEWVHLKRKDHWWKLLGYLALTVHWFDPLVWLGYSLLCRDLEMACDEAVVQSMDLQQRKAYSAALVSCSAIHRSIAACPIAFGEVSVKERVKHVLKFKKPGFWVTVLAVIAAVFVAVFLLTSPGMTEDEILQSLYQQIEEFQNSEEKHIVMTIDMDSEFGMVTGQRQERWAKGEDWYLHIDYETPMGSFVEGYMQLDGIQYAMDHSDEIDGFENRPWAALLEENYMSEWALQTKVFTLLEVLEIREETGEDGGTYTIVLKDNAEPSEREKRYEATYTFRLDGKGKLLGFTRYVHQNVYMSGFGKEGFFDTKSLYTFEILEFDYDEFTQKTGIAMEEIEKALETAQSEAVK